MFLVDYHPKRHALLKISQKERKSVIPNEHKNTSITGCTREIFKTI